jgi:hypothetical protein
MYLICTYVPPYVHMYHHMYIITVLPNWHPYTCVAPKCSCGNVLSCRFSSVIFIILLCKGQAGMIIQQELQCDCIAYQWLEQVMHDVHSCTKDSYSGIVSMYTRGTCLTHKWQLLAVTQVHTTLSGDNHDARLCLPLHDPSLIQDCIYMEPFFRTPT